MLNLNALSMNDTGFQGKRRLTLENVISDTR